MPSIGWASPDPSFSTRRGRGARKESMAKTVISSEEGAELQRLNSSKADKDDATLIEPVNQAA
jgi:hypothetical protein